MSKKGIDNLLKSERFSPKEVSLDSLSRSNTYLKALIQYVTSINQVNSVEEALWLLTDQIIAELGFEDCVVYLFDAKRSLLIQKAAYGNKNPFSHEIINPITLQLGQGIVGKVALQKEPLLISDTSQSDDYIVDDKERKSELAVPILYEDRLIGVIDSEHSEKNFFTPHHVDTFKALASIIATKHENVNAIVQLEKTINQLEHTRMLQQALFDIAELVYTTESLDEFYAELHKIVRSLIKAESFFVCLHDVKSNQLNFPFCFDMERGGFFQHSISAEHFNKSLTAQVVFSGNDVNYNRHQLEHMESEGKLLNLGILSHAWMGVSFKTSDDVRGAVAVQNVTQTEPFSNDDFELLKYIAQQVSIALKRKNDEALLHHLALHDELSGLPNRTLFMDRLSHALDRDKRNKQYQTAVMFLDLDRFKLVNDAYGHQIGDQLIRLMSQRFLQCIRESDTLARLGGDEFAILLEDVDDQHYIRDVASRIIAATETPIKTPVASLFTSVSIGIASSSESLADAIELIKLADNAMYRAKAKGKGCFVYADQDDSNNFVNVLKIEDEISTALREKQFELHLQPVLDIEHQKIVGFESLIRWNHPVKGYILPDYFIDVAEKSGQIIDIDRYVLTLVGQLLSDWDSKDFEHLSINVNLSGNYLSQSGVSRDIQRYIGVESTYKDRLNIEITEKALINNLQQASVTLRELKSLGMKIVLDDFGTGYSSLSYLHQLPIDIVKIDRSFIMSLHESSTALTVVKAIVSLSHSLNMRVVAEGIELEAQRALLVKMNTKFGQGFLFHQPMSIRQAEQVYRQGS